MESEHEDNYHNRQILDRTQINQFNNKIKDVVLLFFIINRSTIILMIMSQDYLKFLIIIKILIIINKKLRIWVKIHKIIKFQFLKITNKIIKILTNLNHITIKKNKNLF